MVSMLSIAILPVFSPNSNSLLGRNQDLDYGLKLPLRPSRLILKAILRANHQLVVLLKHD